MWKKGTRIFLSLLGIAGSFVAAGLMVVSPRAALELLVLASPFYVTAWLIVMLTANKGTARQAALTAPQETAVDPAVVLSRAGGTCESCGRGTPVSVRVRRPARRNEADPLSRFVALCDGCAGISALPGVAQSAFR